MNQLDVEAVGGHRQVGVAGLAEEPGHGLVEPGEIPHVEHDALLVELKIQRFNRYGDSHAQSLRWCQLPRLDEYGGGGASGTNDGPFGILLPEFFDPNRPTSAARGL
ncbi:MAG TPA: hypothetical protein VHO07_19835 [Streptosporangiaceae bacterium]|jgi:hypothetical protein|nr:hypothetical protein [Streptosporangiaceae bacterium]